ncbi:ABATE domain-containing protein, partial [Streptomyces bambusae]
MTDAFVLVGEPLALDLVNTRTAGGDLIARPEDLAAWLERQQGRLTPVSEVGAAELAAVHAVREATRAALAAVRAGSRPDPAELNAALAAAPA